jgi:hypothetical protein
MKTRKTLHPKTRSMWVNEQAETQCAAYVSKFKEKHSETSQPETEDFDAEVTVFCGPPHGGDTRCWANDLDHSN